MVQHDSGFIVFHQSALDRIAVNQHDFNVRRIDCDGAPVIRLEMLFLDGLAPVSCIRRSRPLRNLRVLRRTCLFRLRLVDRFALAHFKERLGLTVVRITVFPRIICDFV